MPFLQRRDSSPRQTLKRLNYSPPSPRTSACISRQDLVAISNSHPMAISSSPEIGTPGVPLAGPKSKPLSERAFDMISDSERRCEVCGARLPANAPGEPCPTCLVRSAIGQATDERTLVPQDEME